MKAGLKSRYIYSTYTKAKSSKVVWSHLATQIPATEVALWECKGCWCGGMGGGIQAAGEYSNLEKGCIYHENRHFGSHKLHLPNVANSA